MSVGEHTVTIYPDPNAGGWADAGIYNASFDASPGTDGWLPSPFCPNLTVPVPGTVRQTATSDGAASIRQDPTRIVARRATGLYRMRMDVTVDRPVTLFYGVNFGDTAANASMGEFWAGTAHAKFMWAATSLLTAGTYSLSMTVNPASVNPAFTFITPGINIMKTPFLVIDYLAVRVDYLVGDGIDISCMVDEVNVQHGRAETTSQPEASTATIDIDLRDQALPSLADIGSMLTVTTELPGLGSAVRFFGRITDVVLGWDDAGEATPEARYGQIVAASLLADLGRRVVGDAPFPQELDGARVARVLGLAGVTTDPTTSDPGTVQILPRDIDAQPALDVAQSAADSAGGIVWQTRDGNVRYADAQHRRGVKSALVLDACDILVTPTWSRTTQGLINKVGVTYGDPNGDTRATGQNDTSIARYGTWDYSLSTELAALADAQAMVGLLLARNATPVWVMTSLPVDMKNLDDERTSTLLNLDMHALITLTGLPQIAPTAPTSADLWLEGWSERLAFAVHEIELHVSGYCRTAPPPRWDDTDPSWTWDTMGDLTWDGAACLGAPTRHDRWTDVPADTRWDTITPPTTTWDTYTGA